jgi:hypothetical protein
MPHQLGYRFEFGCRAALEPCAVYWWASQRKAGTVRKRKVENDGTTYFLGSDSYLDIGHVLPVYKGAEYLARTHD